MDKNESFILMDSQRVARSLKRIAYQIVEVNDTSRPVVLLAINKGGFVIAQKLTRYLSNIYDSTVGIRVIQFLDEGQLASDIDPIPLENSFLILVDDVIFSGGTMFKALRYIADLSDLKEIHTAVLIDRGHRKFPVSAQFSGLELPTKLKEHVSVIIRRGDIEKVILSKTSE